MQYISAVYVYRGSPPVISAIQSDNIIEACLGIDSHADISCAGKLARIIEVIEGETCTVHPFNDSMKPMKNVQTVNVVALGPGGVSCDRVGLKCVMYTQLTMEEFV